MAVSWGIRPSVTIVPTETTTLTDASDSVTTIDSSVDKVVGGSDLLSLGTGRSKLTEAATTTSPVNISTKFLDAATARFLYIKIVSKASSATPDLILTYAGTVIATLYGIESFLVLPWYGTIDLTFIALTVHSSGATTIANYEILGCDE